MKRKIIKYFVLLIICLSFNTVSALALNNQSYIDYPIINTNYSDNITVSGWVMSTAAYDNIKAYIDGQEVNYLYEKEEREDVLNAVQGYGDKNTLPGFKGDIDISAYSSGSHKLKIEFYTNGMIIGSNEKDFNIKESGKIYIDYPTGKIEGTNIQMQGWNVCSSKECNIKVYIDDNEINYDYERVEREDVLNAIKGYGDEIVNTLPGFKGNIDMSLITDGNHTIRVDLLNKNGKVITSSKNNFNLKKYKTTSYIDYPIINTNYSDNITVSGWVMSTATYDNIKAYIDGQEVNYLYEKEEREDVLNAVQGYGDKNTLPGFKGDIDISAYSSGSHKLKIEFYTNGMIIGSNEKDFNIKESGKIYIDYPTGKIEGTNIQMQGWNVCSSKECNIKVYIDDNEINYDYERVEREDVLNAIKGYGDEIVNTLPGFKGNIDMSLITDGNHTIRVDLLNKNGKVITSSKNNFNLKKYKSMGIIDEPSYNYNSYGTNLSVSGWILSESEEYTVQLMINDKIIDNNLTKVKREDVFNYYKNDYNLSNADNIGFKTDIDVSNIKDGDTYITLNIINIKTNEIIFSNKNIFKLKKYNGIMCIDYPIKSNFSSTSNLTVEGWALAESPTSKVKILIDNKEYDTQRIDREDVLNAYQNSYGGNINNPKPGFTSNIPLTSFSEGIHFIRVILYNNMDDEIDEKNLSIFVYSNTYFGIDVSVYQGNINWEQVSKSGIDFAILRLGYGDNFTSQDDKQFINYVNGASQYGIPYGVYLYSYATTIHGVVSLDTDSKSSDSEAYHALRVLNSLNGWQKNNLKLPVFIDMEDNSTIFTGKPILTGIASNFCNILTLNGYKCGVYANKNWLNNYLDSAFLASKYDIWLAHYIDATDYNGLYQIWQYSSTGSLAGIPSQFVDMNVSYKKYW